MRRALVLARRGRGAVSPNPLVGCVLARAGRVVGEGWHARFGGPHAEPAALLHAGSAARGATAYVNLEPCCHQGKTPPCTQALIRSGVRRVVAAMKDPNPRVAGKGLLELRRAGLRVDLGVLESEARRINRAFTQWVTQRRPRVILKAALSLDGRMETAGGESRWITSPQARLLSRRLRAESDAILVGVNTILQDDPLLTTRSTGKKQLRGNPLRVVLDSRLRTPRSARVLGSEAPTVLATRARKPRFPLPATASLLHLPGSGLGLDFGVLLRRLAERGVASLLVEGGSAVHTAFLEKGLVDEVRLFIAPRLIGGAKARSFFEGSGFKTLDQTLNLTEVRVRRVGPDILVTGRCQRTDPAKV